MIKVTLHFASPGRTSAANIIGRLDYGYAKVGALADYKAVMTTAGSGQRAPVELRAYPRWTLSEWDLLVRIICVCLRGSETLEPRKASHGHAPFFDNLTAHVERWPGGTRKQRSFVGVAHLRMQSRKCQYVVSFEDEILPVLTATHFQYAQESLNSWDLLATAYAFASCGDFVLPPRPKLYLPIPFTEGEQSLIALDTIPEPLRTYFLRWLSAMNLSTCASSVVKSPCAGEQQFVEFLHCNL